MTTKELIIEIIKTLLAIVLLTLISGFMVYFIFSFSAWLMSDPLNIINLK